MIKKSYIGGGCFWGLQELFRKQPGVVQTRVGYSGGSTKDPTYENHEGHAEVLEVEYDTTSASYANILDFFFQVHDPRTLNRQGNDVGSSYRSVIFYEDALQKEQAEDFIKIVDKSGKWNNSVVTTLEPFKKFYVAEDYHQNYLQKYPNGYTCHFVRVGSYL
ncbi:peptide-methionine (S)-S-oxide reductase [Candidatus Saccharibacteria bacterium]|nr:peptide-methionine (S)-S-oxide reductase [Candidatus Saccharibacteria bacterium]